MANYMEKTKKSNKSARNNENADFFLNDFWHNFEENIFHKIFWVDPKNLLDLYIPYFFELEGVKHRFERRKMNSSRPTIWKKLKKGTNGPEIVKIVKNLSFGDFWRNFCQKWQKFMYFHKISQFRPFRALFRFFHIIGLELFVFLRSKRHLTPSNSKKIRLYVPSNILPTKIF